VFAAQQQRLSIRFAMPFNACAVSGLALDRCHTAGPADGDPTHVLRSQTPFQQPPELQGLPRALQSLPPAAAAAAAVLVVVLSGAGGSLIGNQLPGAYYAESQPSNATKVFTAHECGATCKAAQGGVFAWQLA